MAQVVSMAWAIQFLVEQKLLPGLLVQYLAVNAPKKFKLKTLHDGLITKFLCCYG